jgi:drug/metabolite transporter (DMT)-like permease
MQGLSIPLLAPFLALGPIALLAQACNIAALRRADASTVGPVGYAWIIFAAAFGWLLFGETPAPLFWPGALLIVLGGVTLARSPAIR